MLEIDSLEANLILEADNEGDSAAEETFEDSIQPIPPPIWPISRTASSDVVPLDSLLDRDSNFVAEISGTGNVNTMIDMARNGQFVKSVQLKSNRVRPIMGSSSLVMRSSRSRVPRMLQLGHGIYYRYLKNIREFFREKWGKIWKNNGKIWIFFWKFLKFFGKYWKKWKINWRKLEKIEKMRKH
jgi:hypothetical protein